MGGLFFDDGEHDLDLVHDDTPLKTRKNLPGGDLEEIQEFLETLNISPSDLESEDDGWRAFARIADRGDAAALYSTVILVELSLHDFAAHDRQTRKSFCYFCLK